MHTGLTRHGVYVGKDFTSEEYHVTNEYTRSSERGRITFLLCQITSTVGMDSVKSSTSGLSYFTSDTFVKIVVVR